MSGKNVKAGKHQPPFLESSAFKALIVFGVISIIALAILLIDLNPDLSHLDVSVLSGSETGNYYAIINQAADGALKQNGTITNVATNGSVDNINQLIASAEKSGALFGLIQEGIGWPANNSLELIARLTVSETVFFLGRNGDAVTGFADLEGKKIGIGPEGSGTAALARQLFSLRGLADLKVTIQNHSNAEQVELLKKGDLDLGMFVIAESSAFIDKAVREEGLQIAGFQNIGVLVPRLPFLRIGIIPAGYFDPVKMIPAEDKQVLNVDTLLVSNGRAARSEIIALLTLLTDLFPGFVRLNESTPNFTGLPQDDVAMGFYRNNGPELMDRYAPWLVDYVPVGNIVQMIMVVSILFNVMGGTHRFRLWRIDANRILLEDRMHAFFGPDVQFKEIAGLQAIPEFKADEKRIELDGVIDGLIKLKNRCRKYSVSMMVPMGQEMGYRYQESLLETHVIALRAFRARQEEAA